MDSGVERLRIAVPHAAAAAPSISQWSVGMHIHHCCLGMIGICQALTDSVPPPPATRFSVWGTLVFLTGRIPRGRGRSPKAAIPEANVSPEALTTLLDESERMLADAPHLDPAAWWEHFVFGVLPRDKAIRFVAIHNHHHARIIEEIMAALP